MKYLLTLPFFILTTLNAQENITLTFSYDDFGNISERKVQVLPSPRLGKFEFKSDSLLEFNLNLFPNPSNTSVVIEGPLPFETTRAQIKLYTLNGAVLKCDWYDGNTKTLDVSNLNNGLYLLEISCSQTLIMTYKIIVSH